MTDTDFGSRIRDELEELSSRTGGHVNLMVRDGWEGVYVASMERQEPTLKTTIVGSQVPLGTPGSGLALLSCMPEPAIDSYLHRQSVIPPEVLDEDVRWVREQGFAARVDDTSGHGYLALAIVDGSGRAVGALSVGLSNERHTSHLNASSIEVLAAQVREVAVRIGDLLDRHSNPPRTPKDWIDALR